MYRRIFALFLLSVAAACQAPPAASPASVMASWNDIPVPRGFHLVDDQNLETPVSAGEYRAGEFLFEGRWTLPQVDQYYRERMPQFGWSWNVAEGCWTKGISLVFVPLNAAPVGAYGSESGLVRYQMRVRSVRPPLAQE